MQRADGFRRDSSMIDIFKKLVPVCVAGVLFAGCAGDRPGDLGVNGGRLKPCPDSPNCVSSQSTDEEHEIDPLPLATSPSEALEELKNIILSMERTSIIEQTDDYLYAEFKSAMMGFVDDVEFYVDAENEVIHGGAGARGG